jgi:ADP-ribose pyrophosphatase YjhB (NUDIX family)
VVEAADRRRGDGDRPAGGGWRTGLHLRAGRLLVRAVNALRPRTTLGVRVLALDAEERIFLVRHSYVPGSHLPGGGVEPGETVREAAAREAMEEGGLAFGAPPDVFGVYLNRALDARDHVVLLVARDVRAGRPRASGYETLAAGFHPRDRLPEDTTPATRARIAEVLDGAAPTEDW